MLALILILAATRISADQIQTSVPGSTRISIEQVAKVASQLAGNVLVIRFTLTFVESGEVRDFSMVAIYPPEQWCTAADPRICP